VVPTQPLRRVVRQHDQDS